jgi:predicted acylesterase/phospholipase RssA
MADTLSYIETINKKENIASPWPGHLPSIIEGLLYHKGIMNEEPMTAYLDAYFSNFTAIERKLVVSAVDVNTGAYKTFTEDVGLKDLGTVIRASTSIPFFFEPTLYNGSLYMDGGTAWNINLKDAVDRCLEVVDDESHIVLDIAITEAVSLKKWEKAGKPLTNYWRSHEIR